MYRSNCLIEAVKSKIKGGKNVHIIVCFPHRGEGMIPHCLWTDKRRKGVVYDFYPHYDTFFPLLYRGDVRMRNKRALARWMQARRER